MSTSKNYLYVRIIREVDMAVLSVGEDGQKKFFDPISGQYLPYSTGQQVKYSVMERYRSNLNVSPAQLMIVHRSDKDGKVKEGEIYFDDPNPAFAELLLRGYFRNIKRKGDKKGKQSKVEIEDEDDSDDRDTTIIKRRSPMSISSLVPLNSRLATIQTVSGSVCVDRTSSAQFHKLVFDDGVRLILFDDVKDEKIRSRMKPRKFDKSKKSYAHGIMVCDFALDLDRLFAVSLQVQEPEVSLKVIENLRANNWFEFFHPQIGNMLGLPMELRGELIEAMSDALINWRITSNQTQHFTPMNTLAVTVSTSANEITSCVIPVFSRNDKDRDILVNFDIEETKNSKVFVSKSIKMLTPEYNGSCSIGAMDAASDYIANHVFSYYGMSRK